MSSPQWFCGKSRKIAPLLKKTIKLNERRTTQNLAFKRSFINFTHMMRKVLVCIVFFIPIGVFFYYEYDQSLKSERTRKAMEEQEKLNAEALNNFTKKRAENKRKDFHLSDSISIVPVEFEAGANINNHVFLELKNKTKRYVTHVTFFYEVEESIEVNLKAGEKVKLKLPTKLDKLRLFPVTVLKIKFLDGSLITQN